MKNHIIIGGHTLLVLLILGLMIYYYSRLKRANHLLQGKEERYRSVIQQSSDCIVLVDLDSLRILDVNPAFLRLLDYTRDEMLQLKLYDYLDHEKQDVDDKVRKIVQESKAYLGERRYRRKNGASVDVEVRVDLIHYSGKEAMSVVARDITERKKTEKKIRASLKEKELLLKEIHHRVKNNIQIVSSLLSLQSGKIKDIQILELFRESQSRIESLALVHESLYQSKDVAEINVSDYVRELADNLFGKYWLNAENLQLTLNIHDINLGIDIMIPCALILNEIISNSLKHAFHDGQKGEIHVSFFRIKERKYRLLVKDNGIGLPQDFDYRNTDSLGIRLVYNLVEQLKGNLEITTEVGTQFEITFSI